MEEPRIGGPNVRCILIRSNGFRELSGIEYHLLVINNHAIGDGTSGMIITNEILSIYGEVFENQDVLMVEINAEILKTWGEAIKPDIPDGKQNYEVSYSLSFEKKCHKTLSYE